VTPRRPALTVAIAGFGTVGRSVARLICERHHSRVRLEAVLTRRPAAARREAPWAPPHVTWTDDAAILLTRRTDVVVELIGGIEPARTWIASALRAGQAVVTANKQVIAEHGRELIALARARGGALGFEAAVAGAVPVIRGLQEGLAGDRVIGLAGVMNGTCSFVLGRMAEAGTSLEEAVAEAQARGLAEADPADDLDGLDARAKLAILASIGFGRHVSPRSIRAASIRGLDAGDIAAAASAGRVIRQVARARRPGPEARSIAAGVSAALVPRDSWLGRGRGAENVVLVHGERSGTTVFAGQGAGGEATAVAVVSDVLAVALRRAVPRAWPSGPAACVRREGASLRYVRVSNLAAAGGPDPARLLEASGIGLERMLTGPNRQGGRWAAIVGPCGEAALDRVLRPLARAGSADRPVVRLPLFDPEI